MHVVLKPFAWNPSGDKFTAEGLAVGDRRDFGALAESLKAEGYIADDAAAATPEAPAKPTRGRRA